MPDNIVYDEIKGKNKRDKEYVPTKTMNYNGLDLPVDVYQFLTNIFADRSKENESNREIAQSYIDNMTNDSGNFDQYIDELRNWIAEEHPGFIDESRSSAHKITKQEKKDAKSNKDKLKGDETKGFTNVPEAPEVTGTEGKVKEFKESDKDKKIREDFEKEQADISDKRKAEDKKLYDAVDSLQAERAYIKDQLKTVEDPDELASLQDALVDVNHNLVACFKALGMIGPGSKERNASMSLNNLLDLYNKGNKVADDRVSQAVEDEVHYGSADKSSDQFIQGAENYEDARKQRAARVAERAENKKALQTAKEALRDRTFAEDLGDEDEVSILTDPDWMGVFAGQSKHPTRLSELRELYKDELENRKNEFLGNFANTRYDDLVKAGLLDKYTKGLTGRLGYDDALAGNDDTMSKYVKDQIMKDLLSESDRRKSNRQRLQAEFMRDSKNGKTKFNKEDIPALAAESATHNDWDNVLYSSFPEWNKEEQNILKQEQDNADKELANSMKNGRLFNAIIKSHAADDEISLEPEQYDIVNWIKENGQDVIDNPKKYSHRARFLTNKYMNTLNKLKAEDAYKQSNQAVRDAETDMRNFKGDYDAWKDFKSAGNVNELQKKLDEFMAGIEKHNKNDEIHSADFHKIDVSPEQREYIRKLRAAIAKASMGKGRKVNVLPLGEGSYGVSATGEGAPYRFIVRADKQRPNNYNAYYANPRLSYEDMEKVSRDSNLSDAEKFNQMYIMDEAAGPIGFVGSNDDLSFRIDPSELGNLNGETSSRENAIANVLGRKLADYGLGSSQETVSDRTKYKNQKKLTTQASSQAIRDQLLNTKGFDNLVNAIHVSNMSPDKQEATLYSVFKKLGLYFDPFSETVYPDKDTATINSKNADRIMGPDEFTKFFEDRRNLGIQASAENIKNNARAFTDDKGNSILTQKAARPTRGIGGKYASGTETLSDDGTWSQNLKKINEGEASPTATQNEKTTHRLNLMKDTYKINPEELIEDSAYAKKALDKINSIADINDREALLETYNDLMGKRGQNILDKNKTYTEAKKKGDEEYKKNDPYVTKTVVTPGADGNYEASGDWFKLFGGAKLKK